MVIIRSVVDSSAPSEFSWVRPRTWSFTIHLALTMVVLASVTLTGVTMVSIYRVQNALTEQIGHQLEAQAQSLNELVAFFLLDKVSDLRVLATSDALIAAAVAKNHAYHGSEAEIMEEILRLDTSWVESVDSNALIDAVTSQDEVQNPAAFQLGRFLKNFAEHTELLLTDQRGATIAATGRLTDYYQADEDWWQAAWDGGKGHVYISQPSFDESAGITAMLIAVPVFNGEEAPIGILRSTLNVADVLSVISTLTIGETGYASLMDGGGNIFRDPRKTQMYAADIGISDEIRKGLAVEAGHQMGEDAIVAHARLVPENIDFSAISAVDRGIVDAIMGLGLVTIVRQERGEALATVSAIESSGRLALYVAFVGTIIIALLAARFVTLPLKRLSLAAEAMGRGRLDTPLPPAYSGEINHLTENLATMASRLQELIASLEARSTELAESNRALTREVGDRIRAEQELKRYRDHLEECIEARTRELQSAQSELMRREKLATLGQLTEKIAQEIRSPLGTVAASLFLIRKTGSDDLDARVENAIDRAERSIKRCDRIVNELFIYSDRQSPSLQTTELDSWLLQVVEHFDVPNSVECMLEVESGANVAIDRERMRQAIDCVLLNGCQAAEESKSGRKAVWIRTRSTPTRVEIRIVDTGPGLEAETESHIFEPLFSTKPTGIGLGLPLAKAILEEHGGGIARDRDAGPETTFLLWLPLLA